WSQILCWSERGNTGHCQTISQSSINDCTEENLCLLVNVPAKLLHEDFDLREGHSGSAGYLHEHMRGVCQHSAAIHQRICKRLRESIVSTIVRVGFTEAKSATTIARAQRCQQIIEADANESRP